jgi:hypothetical protein
VRKSQDGLALALDIAAGTGKDLGAVSMALSKAYGGQTTALSRLGAGLSKATLASGDMDAIMAELNDKFSGQAASSVQGYSGQIALLNVALANASEIIGKDLLDSIDLISGANGIGKTTTAIENMATSIGNATYAVASLINRLKGVYQDTFIGDVFGLLSKIPNLSTLGGSAKARSAGTPAQSPGQRKAIDKANADALKLAKTKNSLSKIDNENTTRKLALTGDQLALIELEKQFDVERIGLFAALNQATDGETQMRLRSLIAIKDQDTALAGQIKATLNAATAMEDFGKAAYGVLNSFLNFGQFAMGERDTLRAMGIGVVPENAGGINPPNYGVIDNPLNFGNFQLGERDTFRDYMNGTNVTVNIAGSLVGQRDLQDAVVQAVNAASSSGTGPGFSRIS